MRCGGREGGVKGEVEVGRMDVGRDVRRKRKNTPLVLSL